MEQLNEKNLSRLSEYTYYLLATFATTLLQVKLVICYEDTSKSTDTMHFSD